MHEEVETSHPWLPESKTRLNNWANMLTAFYAKCVTHGDAATAQKQLKVHQREQVSNLNQAFISYAKPSS